MTMRRAIMSGSAFEEQIGYARAVVDGSIGAVPAEAECTFADVVRVRCLLPDRDDFEPCGPVLRRRFGDVRPAAAMPVCGLADPRMKIEIDVDARKGSDGRD
ncbi:Rid family hydrolase [Streptomyces sviceus]|uniref:Rid family hydrolase n=1 Tax=Streptomyces sviceus TaxID=285530 RepID=UPI00332D62A6